MNYNKFNLMYEEDRLTFILHRDGIEETIKTAKNLIKIYLQTSLTTRQKFHTRNYPYRYSYLESVFSIRYILKSKFLENIDVILYK